MRHNSRFFVIPALIMIAGAGVGCAREVAAKGDHLKDSISKGVEEGVKPLVDRTDRNEAKLDILTTQVKNIGTQVSTLQECACPQKPALVAAVARPARTPPPVTARPPAPRPQVIALPTPPAPPAPALVMAKSQPSPVSQPFYELRLKAEPIRVEPIRIEVAYQPPPTYYPPPPQPAPPAQDRDRKKDRRCKCGR